MRKYINSKLFLLIIITVAAFLRFYQLGINPPGLNWDEAAWAYNSYSLGIDGKDEFGKLPVSYLESYGDYKPPLYAYLGVLPIKIFGLDAFGTRFPSAFFGVLTVLLVYFLVKEVFFKNKTEPKIESTALMASFFLAISPWHIMLSRGAFEANVSTFFIILGIYFFLRAVNKNIWLLIFSAASFAASFYTFNTARIFVPLIVLFIAFMFRKNLFAAKKQVLVSLLVGFILVLPLVPFLFSPQAKLRYQEVNIFSDINIVKTTNQEIANDHGVFWSKVIHNRRIAYGREFLKHYFDNLNLGFLFITGDGNPRFSTQDTGQMYLWDLPFLLVGLYILFRKKKGYYWLLPVWLLLGIIPAATARETPHALRIETVIPTLQIITAYGFITFLFYFKKYRKVVKVLFLIALFLNFYYFYHGYMTHYAREYSSEWQYPYREAVSYIQDEKHKFDKIVITEALGRPYIYFLTYGKFDPKEFRKEAKIEREVFGFVHVRSFDKYKFENDINLNKLSANTLYLDVPRNLTINAKIVKTFYLMDGKPAFIAYETYK